MHSLPNPRPREPWANNRPEHETNAKFGRAALIIPAKVAAKYAVMAKLNFQPA